MNNETRRRDFLFGSAAAVAVPLLPRTGVAPFAKVTTPGPHLGCVTHDVLEDYSLESIIGVLEAAQFEGVELRTDGKHGVEPGMNQAGRERVRKRFDASKIQLVSFGTITEFHSPDAEERKWNIAIAKKFIDLAKDTGAIGVKVRPNGWGEGVSHEVTIKNIGSSLNELGDYGAQRNVEIWMEVHGSGTAAPDPTAAIMNAAAHKNVGLTWNCNPTDIKDGSVKYAWDTLRPWVRAIHLKDIGAVWNYPWHEFFGLLRASGFNRWEYCEAPAVAESDTERYLKWYKTLWTEWNRA
jgi:sugar phosphate isomerase/epimerase